MHALPVHQLPLWCNDCHCIGAELLRCAAEGSRLILMCKLYPWSLQSSMHSISQYISGWYMTHHEIIDMAYQHEQAWVTQLAQADGL